MLGKASENPRNFFTNILLDKASTQQILVRKSTHELLLGKASTHEIFVRNQPVVRQS